MPRDSVKRTRISQACEACRTKKTKCDGQHPICSPCISLGLPCSYDPAPKKRGLPAGHSVMLERKTRVLEFICALFIENVEGSVEAVQAILNTTGPAMIPILLGGKGEDIDHLSQPWKDSLLAGIVENMLNEYSDSVSFTATRDESVEPTAFRELMPRLSWSSRAGSLDLSMTPNRDQTLADLGRARLSSSLPTSTIARTPRQPGFLGSTSFVRGSKSTELFWSNELSPSMLSEPLQVTLPPLPSKTQHLVNVYFSYTHTWLPMVDKYKLISIIHRYPKESLSNPLENSSRASLALLWSVLAYAMAQSANDASSGPAVRERVKEHAYQSARNLIPTESSAYELEDVQTLCLLSLTSYVNGWWSESWMLIGMAGRIATDIGLGQRLPRHSISKHHELEQRTLCGCFVIETLIAAQLGRQTQLHSLLSNRLRDETDGNDNSEVEEGWEEWGSWDGVPIGTRPGANIGVLHQAPTRSLSVFNCLVQLMEILSEVLIAYSKRLPDRTVEQTWHGLVDRCNEWESNLGAYCALQLVGNEVALPHILHLHMMHSTVRNLLYIRFHSTQASDGANEVYHDYTTWPATTAEIAKRFTSTYVQDVLPPTLSYSIAACLHSPSCLSHTSEMLLQILDDLGNRCPGTQIIAKAQKRALTSISSKELSSEATNLTFGERNFSESSLRRSQVITRPEEQTQPQPFANNTPDPFSSTMSFAPRDSIAWPSTNNGNLLQGIPSDSILAGMPLPGSDSMEAQMSSLSDPTTYASVNTDEQLAILDAPDLTDDGIAQFMSNLGYFGDLDENYNFIDDLGHSPTEHFMR